MTTSVLSAHLVKNFAARIVSPDDLSLDKLRVPSFLSFRDRLL